MESVRSNLVRMDRGDSSENMVQKKWNTKWTSHLGEVWHLKGIEIREPLLKTTDSKKTPKSKAKAKEAYGMVEEFWVKEKPSSEIEVVRAAFIDAEGSGTPTKSPKVKGKAKKSAPKAKAKASTKAMKKAMKKGGKG